MRQLLTIKFLIAITFALLAPSVSATPRTLEMNFALSADERSEFSTHFPLVSAGRILIEANWTTTNQSNNLSALTVSLVRPDGSIAATKNGPSAIQLEYRATQQELERFNATGSAKWTLKILNNAEPNRKEVAGKVRVTVPVELRTLEDAQFTLLGSGNAQEISINVPGPGRLEIQTIWETDSLADHSPVPLIVSLIHPGESKTYARRQGNSPIGVDQQITEAVLDRGARWLVRIQNDSQFKVNGRVRVNYTPSL